MRRDSAELGQQGEDLARHIMQVIVEQFAAAIRPIDPPPACEVHLADPLQRKPVQIGERVLAEIDGIGIEVVEIEQ